MATNNADQCHTVRLPAGTADQLRVATGQPFSKLVRFMCIQLLTLERNKRAAAEGKAAMTPAELLQADIASIEIPTEELPDE